MTKEPADIEPERKKAVEPRNAPGCNGPVLCFLEREGGKVQLWGMSLRERLERQFAREGITETILPYDIPAHDGPVILIREDCVIDPPLIPVLAGQSNLVLLSDTANEEHPIAAHLEADQADAARAAMETGAGVPKELEHHACRPAELDVEFWDKLRKREVPYARTVSSSNKGEVEWRMFMGTYKGATDLVTKYLWPRPAFHVTRWLAPTSVTPNQVTALSAVCVMLAFWFFWEGQYVLGLLLAWAMTFLDTVDGKLARTTLASSKWGDIFDHGIDLVHPPFWYTAWALGLAAANLAWTPDVLALVLAAIIGGYIAQRVMEGISIALLGLEIHIWRPVDTFFRLITARRNPNLLIMTLVTVFTGRPDLALELVAWWTVICLVLHGVQLVHALVVRARKGKIVSWMTRAV